MVAASAATHAPLLFEAGQPLVSWGAAIFPTASGPVMLALATSGPGANRLSLIPLLPDFPPIHQLVRSSERRVVQQLAAIPATPPGERATFAVDLPPGRYGLACFWWRTARRTAERGMVAEFRVR